MSAARRVVASRRLNGRLPTNKELVLVSPPQAAPASSRVAASRSFAFVFVCQHGDLEIKSLLLAASLRRHCGNSVELIAAIADPTGGSATLGASTLTMMDTLGVRRLAIRNEIDSAYPIGNKVSAVRVKTSCDRLVFLDSDMVCTSRFADSVWFDLPLALTPADGRTVAASEADWRQVYDLFGLAPWTVRTRTRVTGVVAAPYFNSGFIAVDPNAGFGDVWLDCCRRIDSADLPINRRPWLDQIALPVTVRRLGLPWTVVPEAFNFPVHRKSPDAARPPVFCHYHAPDILRREPMLVALARELFEEHSQLASLAAQSEQWRPILHRPSRLPRRAHSPSPTLLVTGLPRSGTSYLCNLLHRYDDCVVINEPEEIFSPLTTGRTFEIASLLRDIRRDVIEGRPIRNKLKDGQVVEDTLECNERVEYSPAVRSDGFVLGVKNTLSFLSRLDDLREVLPGARIVACVRNPYDTIASWKTAFAHLRDADVTHIPVGGVTDPWLSRRQRLELEGLAAIVSPAARRAAWWSYLANLVLRRAGDLTIVRYQDMVLTPQTVLAAVLQGMDAGALTRAVEPSTVRSKQTCLDEEDRQAIRAICLDQALELGVLDDATAPPAG